MKREEEQAAGKHDDGCVCRPSRPPLEWTRFRVAVERHVMLLHKGTASMVKPRWIAHVRCVIGPIGPEATIFRRTY